MHKPQYFSLSENSLTVSFDNQISVEINQKILNLAAFIKQNPFAGFRELVPAYSTLTVFYDVPTVRRNFSDALTAYETVENFLENAVENFSQTAKQTSREIEIRFDWSNEFALDLETVCKSKKISKKEFIRIFTAKKYRVFMIGFLPGFAYMGEVDERIAAPRRAAPRLKVPKGSIGIAGNQTGIYPLESPGGWQIIGKTDIGLFTPENESPTFLQAGDLVKFVAK